MKRSPKRPSGARPRAAPIPDTSSPKPCGSKPAPPTIAEIASNHLAFLRERLAQLRVSKEDLDDATHEVLLTVWKSLPSYDPAHPAGLTAWLARIAQRYSLRHRAQAAQVRARFVPISPELIVTVDPLPRVDVLTEQSERAKELLRALPKKRRDVLIAHDVDGMTIDEIAEALSIPRGTVASRLRRAREEVVSANGRVEARRRRRGFCVPFFGLRGLRLAAREGGGAGAASPARPGLSGLADRASAIFRRAGRSLAVIAVTVRLPCVAASLPAPEVPTCGLCTSDLIHPAGAPAASVLERMTSAPSAPTSVPAPLQAVTAKAAVSASASGDSGKPALSARSAPVSYRAARPRAVAPRETASDEALERQIVEEARAAVRHGDAARALGSLNLRTQRFPVGPFAQQAEALGQAAQVVQAAQAAQAAHE